MNNDSAILSIIALDTYVKTTPCLKTHPLRGTKTVLAEFFYGLFLVIKIEGIRHFNSIDLLVSKIFFLINFNV